MKLVVDSCVECGACVDACPYALSTKILNCTQCNACVETCPKNAFYEVMPGIYSIDKNICDGCGQCFCPYDALEIKGYARKCDLCGGNPKCTRVCVKGLHLEQTEEERELSKGILGWEKAKGDYQTNMPELTVRELEAIKEIILVFREMVKDEDVELSDVTDDYIRQKKLPLPEERRRMFEGIIKEEVSGFSVLDILLDDELLEEIAVNGTSEILVFHRNKGWLTTDVRFTNPEKLVYLINKMARQIGRRVSLQQPRLNAVLPDGSRLHAVIPPLASEPTITIRKYQEGVFGPKELIANRTISSEALAFLWLAVESDFNILICGPTGSGKTTTLNALTNFIQKGDRVIAVEEIPEVKVSSEHFVRLVVNEKLGATMDTLVTDTLRMRPDKLIVGEIRNAKEVKAFINSSLAGQGRGSMCTFHALSDLEALNRLSFLGVSEQNLNSINLIVVQKRWRQGKTELRRVSSISEVVDSKPVLTFKYNHINDTLERVGELPASDKLLDSLRLSKSRFMTELKLRKSFLEDYAGGGELTESYSNYVEEV